LPGVAWRLVFISIEPGPGVVSMLPGVLP